METGSWKAADEKFSHIKPRDDNCVRSTGANKYASNFILNTLCIVVASASDFKISAAPGFSYVFTSFNLQSNGAQNLIFPPRICTRITWAFVRSDAARCRDDCSFGENYASTRKIWWKLLMSDYRVKYEMEKLISAIIMCGCSSNQIAFVQLWWITR